MDRVSIGRITTTRGLRGELRLAPASRSLDRFSELRTVYLEGTAGDQKPIQVLDAWPQKGGIVLLLEGVDTIEKAQALVGREVLVDAGEAVKLDADEYFVHDLVGLAVVTDRGRHAGVLEEVLAGPANDVYVVRGQYGELLVPAIAAVVLKVDLAARQMLVHDLPGLLEPEEPV